MSRSYMIAIINPFPHTDVSDTSATDDFWKHFGKRRNCSIHVVTLSSVTILIQRNQFHCQGKLPTHTGFSIEMVPLQFPTSHDSVGAVFFFLEKWHSPWSYLIGYAQHIVRPRLTLLPTSLTFQHCKNNLTLSLIRHFCSRWL